MHSGRMGSKVSIIRRAETSRQYSHCWGYVLADSSLKLNSNRLFGRVRMITSCTCKAVLLESGAMKNEISLSASVSDEWRSHHSTRKVTYKFNAFKMSIAVSPRWTLILLYQLESVTSTSSFLGSRSPIRWFYAHG